MADWARVHMYLVGMQLEGRVPVSALHPMVSVPFQPALAMSSFSINRMCMPRMLLAASRMLSITSILTPTSKYAGMYTDMRDL